MAEKASHVTLFFSVLMRKKMEEINEFSPLYRTWIGHIPEVTVLNPAHLEVCFLFPINSLAERTESSMYRGMLLFPINRLAERTQSNISRGMLSVSNQQTCKRN